MAPRALTVEVSPEVRDELLDVARRTRRSPAFLARRALAAVPGAVGPRPEGRVGRNSATAGERVALELATDEDDPGDTQAKIRAAAAGQPLGEALEAAWRETRARFLAWAARDEAAASGERADELDTALGDAADPATPPARLAELAGSEYPRVRALVAAHPSTPAQTLRALAADRERTVRAAALR